MSYVYFKNKPIFESQRPEYRNFLAAVQGAEEEDSCALILPESDILKNCCLCVFMWYGTSGNHWTVWGGTEIFQEHRVIRFRGWHKTSVWRLSEVSPFHALKQSRLSRVVKAWENVGNLVIMWYTESNEKWNIHDIDLYYLSVLAAALLNLLNLSIGVF